MPNRYRGGGSPAVLLFFFSYDYPVPFFEREIIIRGHVTLEPGTQQNAAHLYVKRRIIKRSRDYHINIMAGQFFAGGLKAKPVQETKSAAESAQPCNSAIDMGNLNCCRKCAGL